MSVYSVKGKGWRYDFTQNRIRHTEAWFRTKAEAMRAEAQKRKELDSPQTGVDTPTDMGFLELVNRRLDHVKAYNSERHYQDYLYMARRWMTQWGKLTASQVTTDLVEQFILKRAKVSKITANKEIRYLRATFNFGKRRKWIQVDPTDGMAFLPTVKTVKAIPSASDIDRVIAVADPDTQDYLWVLRDTMARVSEVNRLTWNDVDFQDRHVVLYTRKKAGGHMTPRKVPMTEKLFEVLSRRHLERDQSKPWVFWHIYWSSKTGQTCEGPFLNRSKIMRTLCQQAGVTYFRFHPIRHHGASTMDASNVSIGAIQRILGHENRTTTEIYLHSIGTSEREAMAAFESARQKSHTKSHTTTGATSHGTP